MFVYDTESREGNGTMSENELELISMIRACNDQKEAFLIALDIICKYIQENNLSADTLTLSNKQTKITA